MRSRSADALEIARVGDFRSVVRLGQFRTGDLGAYIPEGAVVPEPVLETLGLVGRLAGRDRNRVKAVRLRGVLSQGIVLPAAPEWALGDDVADELGIVKYVPPVPTSMSGQCWAAGPERTLKYDIENVKRYPDVFRAGEEVVYTEKIHGTWMQVGVVGPELADPEHGDVIVASKGLGAKGLAFMAVEENRTNLYLRTAAEHRIPERIRAVFGTTEPTFVLGEVFGRGVQDLAYGADTSVRIGYRVFDIYRGRPGHGRYLDHAELDAALTELGLPRVPVLAREPFDPARMQVLTDGRETLSGTGAHVREGVVVRPVRERRDDRIGRVQLKSVSAAYLLRKGGTEFN
jgi:RNA ligase (TIGR02306 family)